MASSFPALINKFVWIGANYLLLNCSPLLHATVSHRSAFQFCCTDICSRRCPDVSSCQRQTSFASSLAANLFQQTLRQKHGKRVHNKNFEIARSSRVGFVWIPVPKLRSSIPVRTSRLCCSRPQVDGDARLIGRRACATPTLRLREAVTRLEEKKTVVPMMSRSEVTRT